MGQKITEQPPCIYCIVDCKNETKSKILQEKFQDFISTNLKQVEEEMKVSVYEIPDQNDIDRQIKLLNTKHNSELLISSPKFDQQKGIYTYIIQIRIFFLVESYQPLNHIQIRFENIKKEIINIYLPIIEIQLQTVKEIKIWENFLAEEFEKTLNSQECKIKYPQNDLAIIQLSSFQQNAARKKELIQTLLKSYDYIEIDLFVEHKFLKLLSDSLIQKLFKTVVNNIILKMQNSAIKYQRKGNDKIWFEVYLFQSEIRKKQVEDLLQNLFIQQITIQKLNIDLEQILTFLQISENQFTENYQVGIIKKLDEKPKIIGLQNKINEILIVTDQIEENRRNNQQTEIVTCQNILIFEKLQQSYDQLKRMSKVIKINFQNDGKIMITGDKSETIAIVQQIISLIKKFENDLVQSSFDFCEKEIKYVRKHLQNQIDQYQQENKIIITYSQPQLQNQQLSKSIATELCFNGKKLKIVFADISRTECDAIVNSCNDQLSFGDPTSLSGVAQSIFDMAGSPYHVFCQDYISKNKRLQFGTAITYDMPQGKHIKHIINVATPIYSNGIQTNLDLQEIEKNIESIFKEVDRLKIKSLALPIFGGGACGYNFNQVSEIVLKSIINNLFSNQYSIQTIYITETMDCKIIELQQTLQFILEPNKQIRKVQYQWQWQSDDGFTNYDDQDINRQIDEAYEKFRNTNQEQTIIQQFSFTKQPGTHSVDLKKLKFIDISLNKQVPFSFKIINNSKKFFINNEEVNDQLNEYLILQERKKQEQFQIFYKRHQIVINNQEMYQKNLETSYKRKIQNTKCIEYKKQQEIQLILIGKKFDLHNYQYQKVEFKINSQPEMLIQSFDDNLNKRIISDLKARLQQKIIKLPLMVPEISNEDLESFVQFLQQNSIRIIGQVVQGRKIDLDIFAKKQALIQQYMKGTEQNIKSYPSEWVNQSQNLLKQQLQQGTQEYNKILQLFNKTDNGTVHAIFRIQNKNLWNKYISEKKNLIDNYKQQNIQLSPIEQSRYLWHGVSMQHPQVIYSGLKEAFDQTYCWYVGCRYGQLQFINIYLAENAKYSRDYSYQITQQEDRVNAGRKVFLCCLVTTGRVDEQQPNHQIKRPSPGFDCVSGVTGGSNIFILYQMDLRRAYPAYEVIYS